MKTQNARILLTAVLFVLCSAALLSGHSIDVRDKAFSTLDPFTSAAVIAGDNAKKPEGDHDQVHEASPLLATSLFVPSRPFSHTTPPVLRHLFRDSLARAPPLP